MAEIIRMPLMSDTMKEGEIIAWLKNVGDTVEAGDILAEVATDKATMELESYWDGVILHIGVQAGESCPVNGILLVIGEEGEDYKDQLDSEMAKEGPSAPEPKSEDSAAEPKHVEKEEVKTPVAAPAPSKQSSTSSSSDGRLKASPLAKKMAEEKGIDLGSVTGTGDNGRIVRRDIESYTPSATTEASSSASTNFVLPQVVGEEQYEEVKASQMRKVIASRLSESKFGAPHFYLTMDINMDKAMEARKAMNEISPVKISFNDLVIKSCAASLRQHPEVNSSWLGDKIRYNKHIHIGMAVAIEDGLVVPVIKFADNKTISHISAEAKAFAGKARDKKLTPEEFTGNTFTISNLGMFDIEEFTAIINPPDACILAIGAIKQVPAVIDGEIKISNQMRVTLSCDHRVVDGVKGAQFLQTMKGLLENPVKLLV